MEKIALLCILITSILAARVAQDLGISVADLRVPTSRDKTAADLLDRRLEALRLDPTSIDPALMRDLQRCCSSCESKQLCAHELEDQPKAAEKSGEPHVSTYSDSD
jgi:hypothetical protein